MKRFRRIFLHIGPHKTGSSAVQLMCDENRSRLAAAGIYYPRGRWHGQLGSYFSRRKAAYVFNRHAGNIDAAAIEASDLAYMGGLEQELNEVGTENLLFSYEGFIDLDSEELTALRNFLLGYSDEIQVIGYCRHPLSFVPSEISQRCRMGVPSGRDNPRELPIPKFRDYFEKFEAVFGRERVSLADFAPETLHEGDIRRDFLGKIGIFNQQQTGFRLSDARVNEGLSAEAILIGEAIAKQLPPSARGNLFFMKFNMFLESVKGSPLSLSDSEKSIVMDLAEPHLDYLKTAFDLTLHAPAQTKTRSSERLFGEESLRSLANYFVENDAITQAYRWLLVRRPESEEVTFRHLKATGGDWRQLRKHVMRSPEFGRVASANIGAETKMPIDSTTRPLATVKSSGAAIPPTDVTVCMIVHNEEEMLHESLSALIPIFNSFVIVDMGSSDRTLDVIKDYLGDAASIIHYERAKLLEHGYAAARSFCAQHAVSQWTLMIDADEILVAGIEQDKIGIDRALDRTGLATIERRNLIPPDGSLPAGVRPAERPRRLYRNNGAAFWTGYIHEELTPAPGVGNEIANSSLVFNHLSALRDPDHLAFRRSMYRWMLLRAYENPAIRGGTNTWWYEEFVPRNIQSIRADAEKFRLDKFAPNCRTG